jgi:hypothetical protein
MKSIAAVTLVACMSVASNAAETVPPPEHRPEDQTFLTFPEWYLVYSPAEYAAFVTAGAPSAFPFFGHIRQFWRSYSAVTKMIIDRKYPLNAGYHVMIWVIGLSTTVEYALRGCYETLIGRLTELLAGAQRTEEDRYAARIAQAYVDFINVRPWYEFDFVAALTGLWRETSWHGPAMVRKWERKYVLTTEYAVKAAYAWLIAKGTAAGYEAPLHVTTVVLAHPPEELGPNVEVLERRSADEVLVTLPRYDAFKVPAQRLAVAGADFREIAGNGPAALIAVSVVVARRSFEPPVQVVFTLPILTRAGYERLLLAPTVTELGGLLRELHTRGIEVEHVYDY